MKKPTLIQCMLAAGLLAAPLFGQATPDTGYCQTPPLAMNFVIEYTRPLDALKSTLQATIPPALLAQLLDPKNEIHDRITYDAATNQLVNRVLLVPKGSPTPLPSNSPLILSGTILYIFVNVDRVIVSCTPYASVMVVGVIREGVPLLGDPKGAPYMFSFAYNLGTSTPSRLFRDIMSASSGLGNAYQGYGSGTLTVFPTPVP